MQTLCRDWTEELMKGTPDWRYLDDLHDWLEEADDVIADFELDESMAYETRGALSPGLHPGSTSETQLHDLRQLAQQRGLEIVGTYTDYLSSTKIRRRSWSRCSPMPSGQVPGAAGVGLRSAGALGPPLPGSAGRA